MYSCSYLTRHPLTIPPSPGRDWLSPGVAHAHLVTRYPDQWQVTVAKDKHPSRVDSRRLERYTPLPLFKFHSQPFLGVTAALLRLCLYHFQLLYVPVRAARPSALRTRKLNYLGQVHRNKQSGYPYSRLHHWAPSRRIPTYAIVVTGTSTKPEPRTLSSSRRQQKINTSPKLW